MAQVGARLGRGHGHGGDDPVCVGLSCGEDGGAHRGPCGETIVDEYDVEPRQMQCRARTAIGPASTQEFDALLSNDLVDEQPGLGMLTKCLLVEDLCRVAVEGRDGAQGIFLESGHPQFADWHHIERRAEELGDLVGYGHAAAWKSKYDDRMLAGRVVDERGHPYGQLPAGIAAVAKCVRCHSSVDSNGFTCGTQCCDVGRTSANL
jgi:hypothetical protein